MIYDCYKQKFLPLMIATSEGSYKYQPQPIKTIDGNNFFHFSIITLVVNTFIVYGQCSSLIKVFTDNGSYWWNLLPSMVANSNDSYY